MYRLFLGQPKFTVKVMHAALQLLVLAMAAFGLKTVFDSHNLAAKPIPNMYSLHSWVGLSTVVLFGLQASYSQILSQLFVEFHSL